MIQIYKPGIMYASGDTVDRNIVLNTEFKNNTTTNWTLNNTWNFVEKDGHTGLHHTGALKTTAYARPNFVGGPTFTPTNGTQICFSVDVLLDNVTAGTTNYLLSLYRSGATIDGTWRSLVVKTQSPDTFTNTTNTILDPAKLNGKGWTRVWVGYEFGNYAWPARYYAVIYARDYTGDFYFRNMKVEYGLYPTPWTDDTTADVAHGFTERVDELASFYEGHAEAYDFVEI